MAITQQQVSDWFKLNPNATPEQVAQLVQSIGGLAANPGLANLIGNQYGMSGLNIGSIFENLTGQVNAYAPSLVDPAWKAEFDKAFKANDRKRLDELLAIQEAARLDITKSNSGMPTTSIEQMQSNTKSINALEDFAKKYQASEGEIIGYAEQQRIDPNLAKKFAKQYALATSSQVRDAFTNPSTKSADIVLRLQAEGISPETVAKYTGITPQRASQIYTATLKDKSPGYTPDFGAVVPTGLMQATTAGGTTTANTAGTNQTQTATVSTPANVQKVIDALAANPAITDRGIVSAMKQFNVSPKDIAQSFGLSEGQIISRIAATVPDGQTIQIADTIIQPKYQVVGSGQDAQTGALENVYTYRASDNKVGGGYTQYKADGTLERTGTQMKVDASKDFVKFALTAGAIFGGAALSGLNTAVKAVGLTAAEAAGLGLTASEAAALGFSSAELAAAGFAAADITADTASTGLLSSTATAAANAANAATAAATGLTVAQVADLTKAGLTAAQITGLFSGSNTSNLSNLFSGGLTTAGSLLQQQTSKEAADKARAMIEAETAAGKTAAQFKPIGMTTRFGTSQFQVDPVTGQLTSAGYTLSPEAKAQQDRFVALSNQGLTQAEGAQAQFAPLQTGAQSLFGLGNKYLAQSPEAVAQNYLNQQMALLQPGRELELANLQNKLQQQGRGGLAVAQGGTLGDTTPELQALFNARAQQEAQLAANAQQAGQQQVAFGAGLLGTGAQTMGQYYAGQQAAYAPYTTAMGQAQSLEILGQQPLSMASALGQQSAAAGKNIANIGLTGAQLSTNLATSANATANPYAQALMAAGNPNAMFGQTLNKIAGGLFGNTPATSGFSYGQYGTGIDPSTGEYFGSLYF